MESLKEGAVYLKNTLSLFQGFLIICSVFFPSGHRRMVTEHQTGPSD